jgi:hypothetical protein
MNCIIILIFWVLFCILTSTCLKYALVNHIYKKPPVSSTVIDLAYADCFIFIYMFEIIFGSSIILCITSENLALSFELSLAITVINYFVVSNCQFSLTITGILRFVSLINKSEEIGIQSLGPDYLAIWKIRLMSFGLTLILLLSNIMCFHSIPILFYTLYSPVSLSYTSIYEQDPYIGIYITPLVLASVANVVPKLYAIFTTKNFTNQTGEKFVLSLTNVLGFPSIVALIALSQFQDRFSVLTIHYPSILAFSSIIIPTIIIFRNEQLKKSIFAKMKNIFVNFSFPFKITQNEVYPLTDF